MKDRKVQEHAGLQVRFGYSVTASSTAYNGNVELGQYLYESDTDPTVQLDRRITYYVGIANEGGTEQEKFNQFFLSKHPVMIPFLFLFYTTYKIYNTLHYLQYLLNTTTQHHDYIAFSFYVMML